MSLQVVNARSCSMFIGVRSAHVLAQLQTNKPTIQQILVSGPNATRILIFNKICARVNIMSTDKHPRTNSEHRKLFFGALGFWQREKRRWAFLPAPKRSGISRRGAPVQNFQITAPTNSRSPPSLLRPTWPGLPGRNFQSAQIDHHANLNASSDSPP